MAWIRPEENVYRRMPENIKQYKENWNFCCRYCRLLWVVAHNTTIKNYLDAIPCVRLQYLLFYLTSELAPVIPHDSVKVHGRTTMTTGVNVIRAALRHANIVAATAIIITGGSKRTVNKYLSENNINNGKYLDINI